MRRVETDRYKQWLNLTIEILTHPCTLGGIAFTVRNNFYVLPLEGGQQLLVVKRILPID